jgi:hypothetical protein
MEGLMKYRRLHPALALLVCGSLFLLAGQKDYWEGKPYTEWNDQEVDKLLKDSPWTRSVFLSTGPERGLGPGGPRSSGGGGDAEMVSSGGSLSKATTRLVVTWFARPIREAMARRLMLKDPAASKDRIEKLLHPNDQFMILLVNGWTLGWQPDRNAAIERFKKETVLLKKGKEKIPLADVVLPQRKDDPLYLRFEREIDGKQVLAAEDQDVTLMLRVGEDIYRLKFKLADMLIHGRLEL